MLLQLLLSQSLAQPTSEALYRIWTAATEPAPGLPQERRARPELVERSWSTVRLATAYGIPASHAEERYRFRIPPDWDEPSYRGGAFRVESYLDGFPVTGRRADGDDALARPLGFEYGRDGYCTNAEIGVWKDDHWATPRLTNRAKTLLIGRLALFDDRYGDRKAPVGASRSSQIWFRVVAKGYGAYSFYRDLTVVGPEGTRCKLVYTKAKDFAEILRGDRNEDPDSGSPT